MPDLDRNIYEQLQARSARVIVSAGDVDAVVARGRARRRRRRGATGLAVIAAAGAVTGGVLTHTSQGHKAIVSTGIPTVPAVSINPQLTWRAAPVQAGLSPLTSLSNTGGAAYAVSTAPGQVVTQGSGTTTLYRSSDGLTWTPANGPAGLSVADVSVDGSRVYSVGTGQATAATAVSSAEQATVSWTANGGGSWQHSALPVDLSAPAGSLTINGVSVQVAAGQRGVVAVLGVGVTFDLSRALPAAGAAPWAATPEGVELLGSNASPCGPGESTSSPTIVGTSSAASRAKALLAAKAAQGAQAATPGRGAGSPSGQVTNLQCYGATGQVVRTLTPDQAYPVVGRYSWSQLHVNGQAAASIEGQPLAFYSSDSSQYRQVSLPGDSPGYGLIAAAGPAGFAVVANDTVLQSSDGVDWTAAPALPADTQYILGAGYVGGRLVLVGAAGATSPGEGVAYSLSDAAWTAAPLPVAPQTVSWGPVGVASIGLGQAGSSAGESWEVLFSRDGVHWSSGSLTALTQGQVSDASVVVGSSHVAVTVTRPPATPASIAPATQVGLVGTPETTG
jgi:hypothetical protein